MENKKISKKELRKQIAKAYKVKFTWDKQEPRGYSVMKIDVNTARIITDLHFTLGENKFHKSNIKVIDLYDTLDCFNLPSTYKVVNMYLNLAIDILEQHGWNIENDDK